jgi:intein/homing endonuclease
VTRELISGKLSVGDRAACNAPRLHSAGKSACIVHGCKTCHQAKAGKLSPTDKRYLSFVEQGDLYLNLIDATTAYFQTQSFTAFLRFARDNWLDDRPITIHCDQGRSRAPMLAVLFMAKVLEIIPNTSLDDAMDAFEAQHGKLEPSEGIETYLRKNWHGIESMPVNYRGPNRRSQQYRPPDTSQITNDEAVALIQGSPIVHFATMVEIEDKDHNMVTPVPNILQMRINEAYEWCIENGIAPRLQALKPRQKGSSTFFGELFYHHARRFHTDGLIIGDESSRVMKVWQIFTEYSIRDKFPWDSKFAYDTKKASFTYADGTKGLWEYDTANDPKAGISGTRQAIWYTEAARYPKSGSRTDVKVITASLASLSKGPRSLAAMESTAEGANGFFYNNWQGAVSLEDMKAGKFGNGWIKIFAAWFEFADGVLPRAPHYEEHFHTTYSYREKRGRQLYGWTAEQIAWRRYTIASECDGDESIFDQDYPENDRDCIGGDVRIGTSDGLIPIRDARIGARCDHGIIVAKKRKGVRATIEVTTKLGYRVTCTADHRLAMPNGDFVMAHESLGQTIALQPPIFSETIHEATWDGFAGTKVSLTITEKWGRLLGYFMGDGSFHGDCISFCCCDEDMDVGEDIASLVNELMGESSTRQFKHANAHEVRLSRNKLSELLTGLGVIDTYVDHRGVQSYRRRITVPECIWRSPRFVVREFLRGLFESDGWVSKTGRSVKFFAKDPELCQQVQLLLLGFGIHSNINHVIKKTGGKEYPGCELALWVNDALRFMEVIGFVSARKQSRRATSRYCGRGRKPVEIGMADTVVGVEYAGESDVWDIQIEGTAPVFGAGGILVHNCFLQSGRPRFDDDGVTRLEIMAEREHDLAERGILTGSEANVIFVPQKEDAWLWLKEKPIRGCAYIVAIDPCQGSQSNGAKNPDAHACVVLRQPYICEKNVLHPVAVVAAIHVEPSGCRWDDSIIAERAVMLANFFGSVMIVPETGNGLGVLVKLRDFGGNIYQRQKPDSFIPGKMLPTAGWETNSATRDMWVGAIADAIREGLFDCAFRPAVAEFRTFVIDDRGKAQAAPSKHDDFVAAIGIGLYCLNFAGVYKPIPPRSMFAGDKKRSSMFS